MQVIFIHQSCFLVEIDEKVFIFDYFGADRVNGYHFTGKLPTYEKDTPIYMFVSHGHLDHFDPAIFRLTEQYSDIHFIISSHVARNQRELQKKGYLNKRMDNILMVKENHKYECDGILIETFRSTEAGVAFYVSCNGVSLFHAGDLGDWRWEGVGELINGKMTREYRREIHKLSNRPINLAFVPMDPRLEAYQTQGIDFFVRNTDAEFIFPMHMWQDYSGISRYKKQISNLGMADRIIEIERENQVFPFGEN